MSDNSRLLIVPLEYHVTFRDVYSVVEFLCSSAFVGVSATHGIRFPVGLYN